MGVLVDFSMDEEIVIKLVFVMVVMLGFIKEKLIKMVEYYKKILNMEKF